MEQDIILPEMVQHQNQQRLEDLQGDTNFFQHKNPLLQILPPSPDKQEILVEILVVVSHHLLEAVVAVPVELAVLDLTLEEVLVV